MIDHRRMPTAPQAEAPFYSDYGEEAARLLSPKPLHDELVVDSVLFWIKSPLRVRFFIICAAIFSNMFLFGLFIGLAPFYQKDLDLSQFELGLVFSSFSMVPLLLIPMLGLCIHKTPQKLFFGVGGVICAIAALIMAVYDDTFAGVVIARLLHGFGATVVWITGPAVVAEVFAVPTSTRALSVVYIFTTAAYLVGTVMGANSFDWTGSTVPIYISTFLMNLCMTVFVLGSLEPDTHSVRDFFQLVSKQTFWEGWSEYQSLLSQRPVITLLANVFFFSIATVVLQTFIPSWVKANLGTSVSGAADIYAVMGFAKISSQPFFGRLTRKLSPHLVASCGMMMYGLMLPLLPLAWNLLTDVIAFTLVGLAMTATLLPSFISLSQIIEEDGDTARDSRRFTLANSLWLLTFMAGSTIAPMVFGAILDSFPPTSHALETHIAVLGCLGAVMTLVQGPIYFLFSNADHERSLEITENKQYC